MYNLETLKSEYPQHQEIILYFKTTPCQSVYQDLDSPHKHPNNRPCFQASCYHYHNMHEARRPVLDEQSNFLLYDPIPCPSQQEGYLCPEGIRCRYCHTQNELNYHPLFYKTEPCMNCMFPGNIRLCPYYHHEEINRKSFVDKIMMNNSNESQVPMQFNLDMFKVRPCIKKGNHNLKICDYYHHEKDRRRPTNIFMYTPPICPYVTRNANCPDGDNCRYAHNKLEQLYHPERYKRKFCLHHPLSVHKCEYGNYCSFAHNEAEIVIELLHSMKQDENFYLYKYKTVFCPYIYEHDRNQCIYAHNPQDLRRDPNQYKYNAVQCPYWLQGQIFSYEEGGCPKQMNCENCHGWKELEYHPLYYKTKPCNNGKKCNKKDCPFYHSSSEKRLVKITSQLTRSLFHLKSNMGSPLQAQMFIPESHSYFETEGIRMPMERKTEVNLSRPAGPVFTPFKPNEPEYSKKVETKSKRLSDSPPGITSFMPSTNLTEDELATSLSYKMKTQVIESPCKKTGSISGASVSSDKMKFDQSKSAVSQTFDLWGSFQPTSFQLDYEDKLDDFFTITKNMPSKADEGKLNESFYSSESDGQLKQSVDVDKLVGLTNDQFKKAFIYNLEKRGLSHTVQYLLNPIIDLKVLKTFSQKDFYLFPHISLEDKEKIVEIIRDVLEEEALLSEVNTINDCECQLNHLSADGNSFKGSFDKDQDFISNLTNHLERLSYQ